MTVLADDFEILSAFGATVLTESFRTGADRMEVVCFATGAWLAGDFAGDLFLIFCAVGRCCLSLATDAAANGMLLPAKTAASKTDPKFKRTMPSPSRRKIPQILGVF